ncbi:hypothetical protein K1719_032411 [Acacia pycnantha]|nr:hypothetical protein K1719_032411 [Acacia pycnantha]
MSLLRRDRVSLKPCKAFRTEEGGDSKEKRHPNLKKLEMKLKRENEFWSFASSIISSTFKVGSKLVDDYRLAMAKVEEVLSSCYPLLQFTKRLASKGVKATVAPPNTPSTPSLPPTPLSSPFLTASMRVAPLKPKMSTCSSNPLETTPRRRFLDLLRSSSTPICWSDASFTTRSCCEDGGSSLVQSCSSLC